MNDWLPYLVPFDGITPKVFSYSYILALKKWTFKVNVKLPTLETVLFRYFNIRYFDTITLKRTIGVAVSYFEYKLFCSNTDYQDNYTCFVYIATYVSIVRFQYIPRYLIFLKKYRSLLSLLIRLVYLYIWLYFFKYVFFPCVYNFFHLSLI